MPVERKSEPTASFSTLFEILRWRAANQPHKRAYTFLVDGDNEEVNLTYAELDERSRAIAAQLQERKAVGERVLLVYPAGLDYVAAFLGCLYSGAIAVPVYPPRANRSLDRLKSIVNDSRPAVILTTSQIGPKLAPLTAESEQSEKLSWIATDVIDGRWADQWRESVIKSDMLAFLQYTSGSTAAPKGAMVSHGNLMHNQEIIKTACQHNDQSTFVSWLPMFHDMGLIGNVLQPLYLGSLGVLMWPTSFLQRPFCWLKAISKYKAHTSGGPNFAFDLCVRKIRPEQREELDLNSWRVAFNGAELVRSETIERFSQVFGSCGFRAESMYPCYGLAEATLFVSGGIKGTKRRVLSVDGAALDRHQVISASDENKHIRKAVSCGTAWVGQQIAIVNPDTLVPCSENAVGEIWVKGESVVQGYWNRTDITERTFKAFISTTGEGPFLRTGDLGFINDGELYVTGRLKDLIIIRGHNHYPEDIEQTAGQSHNSLRPGCGIAFSVDTQGEERLVVVHELERSSEPVNVEDVAGVIRQAIADCYELQAYAVVLVEPGSIPKTSSGKLQRHVCRSAFLNSELKEIGRSLLEISDASTTETSSSPESFIRKAVLAMESEKERTVLLQLYLQQQVAQILRISPSSLDVQQPLTRLGLDSLMATELQSQLESQLGVLLSMSGFLQGITIDQLTAQVLRELFASGSVSALQPTFAQYIAVEFPLSYGQRALWFLYQLAPDNPAYNIIGAARILGDLDVAALRQAFQHLANRHSSLRTRFAVDESGPVQRIDEYQKVSLGEIDASSWTDELLNERMIEESHARFNLEQGPLLRVNLYRQSNQRHVILLVVHHIVVDLWSLAVLMNELGKAYDAQKSGQPVRLDPLPFQYSDYVRWQGELLTGSEGERLQSYWQNQLAGHCTALDLPTDRPRPLMQTYHGDSLMFAVNSDLTQKLNALGRAHDATDYMTLMTAFQVLLYRYTGQEDLLVGSPTTGRSRASFAPLVGYFVNPIVIRGDLKTALTFEDFLNQMRSTVLGAFAAQEFPFALLVDRLRPERDPSRTPIFNVMFVFQQAPAFDQSSISGFALGQAGAQIRIGDLCFESLNLDQHISQFDLTLTMAEVDDGLAGTIQYNTDLFGQGTIARMAANFERLIESIVAHPQERISTLPLLTEKEFRQIVIEWNTTKVEYPCYESLHNLIEAQVERTPEAIAVAHEGISISYQELNRRANRLAQYLIRAGISIDDRVGVCMERSIEMVVALLGILKAGAAYLPIDPAYPVDRISYLLEDAQAGALLTQKRLLSRISNLQSNIVCLDSDWDSINRYGESNPVVPLVPDNLAYVIYTSGSTGKPKGAMIPHRGICNRLLWMQDAYKLNCSDSVLQKTSFTFDVSVWEFFWPLMTGACLVVAPRGAHHDTDELASLIIRQQITTIHFVPSMLQAFLNSYQATKCHSLLRVISSGETLSTKLQDRFFESLETELHNLYGPTEASVDVTFWACSKHRRDRTVPIGRPIANTQVHLLDADLNPIPIGVSGELHIGGVSLARGYLNRPDLTAEKFIPDPFSGEPGSRLYKTADLCRHLADGEIDFFGRIDHQVKIRGFRIELGEIEYALSLHPTVLESVVIADGNVDSDKRLVAYFVSDESPAPTAGQLRSFLKERLPEHLIPSLFVPLEVVPLTSSGKVDRKALPRPDGARPESKTQLVLPRTTAERLLARIWSEVLRIKEVGVHDNFFELGGDSILSLQIIARANQAGFRLSPKHMLQYQTIGELVLVADPSLAVQAEQGIVIGTIPVTPIQHWFFEQELTEPEHYNQALLLRLREPVDATLVKDALGRILMHHDALRLRFRHGESGWQQFNEVVNEDLPLTLINLSATPEPNRQSVIDKVAAELRTRLNFSEGPMIRVAFFEDGPFSPGYLLIIVHHLAIDAVSWRILLDDLQTAILQLNSGESVTLPLKTASYKCWAERLVDYAQSDAVQKELPHWLSLNAGANLQLPVDETQGLNSVASEKAISISLNVDETTALLRGIPQPTVARIEDILLTALAQSVARWTGKNSVLIDAEAHGREEIFEDLNLSRTVGWFTSVYPVLLNVNDATTGIEAVKSIRAQFRQYQSRNISYGLLRYLSADTSVRDALKSLPQPEILFNFIGQVDQLFSETSLFALINDQCGPTRGPQALRRYLLEVTGIVVDRKLRLNLIYSENIHRRETIDSLANDFANTLRSLISREQINSNSIEASDADDNDDSCAISPMQKSLLLHTLYVQKRGVYIEQLICTLLGSLDIEAFDCAWQQVIDCHPVLRTSFRWKNLAEPIQVLESHATLPVMNLDWRSLSSIEQQEQLDAFLKSDREQEFDLSSAPLMRLALIRTTADSYQFIFTFHHLLMDGWSLSLVLQEVFESYEALYRGESPVSQKNRLFKAPGTRQECVDVSEAERYWRENLKGFTSPTVLMTDQYSDLSMNEDNYYQQRIQLSKDETAPLKSFALQHHLTLNTLVQSAWALLLSRYAAKSDVVFGVTVSGRNTGLVGIESEVGLFINTLPLRVRVSPDDSLVALLKNLQTSQAELHQYEHCSLADIHKWCVVPPGLPIFETQLIFQNYPVNVHLKRYGNVQIQHVDFRVSRTNFALSLMVFPDAELSFLLVYDGRRFSNPVVSEILKHLCALLKAMVEDPNQAISNLLACIPDQNLNTSVSAVSDSVPSATDPEAEKGHSQSFIEKIVGDIFAEILQTQSVGLNENFFALGGDSLRALQVLIRVQEIFQVEISPQSLSAAPTIAGLALAILKKQAESLTEADELLENLEQLSEEDAVRLLAEMERSAGD